MGASVQVINGLKFKAPDGITYTIRKVANGRAEIAWGDGADYTVYPLGYVQSYFDEGSWIAISSKAK